MWAVNFFVWVPRQCSEGKSGFLTDCAMTTGYPHVRELN